MRGRAALLGLAGALALGGCGGGARPRGPEQAVTEAFQSYRRALQAGDYAAACSRLSAAAASRVVAAARGARVGGATCPEGLHNLHQATPSQLRDLSVRIFSQGRIRDVVVHGRRASVELTVSYKDKDRSERFGAVREDGTWKVSGLGS